MKILKIGLIILAVLVGLFVLLIVLALIFGDPETGTNPSQPTQPTAAEEPPTPIPEPTLIPATPAPPPTTVPQPTAITFAPVPSTEEQLAALVEEARNLYIELQEFKDDPEFIQVGFGVCCRFNDWKLRAERFGDAMPQDMTTGFLGETGFLPGELLALGQGYVSLNTGLGDSELVRRLDTAIASGLGISPPTDLGEVQSQGVVATTDYRCKNVETYVEFYARLEAKDFGGAAEVMDSPDCLEVVQNTQVSGPIEVTDVAELGGQITQYALYALPDSTELWFREDEVSRE